MGEGMRKVICFILLLTLCAVGARAQQVQDALYRVVAHIKSDGTIQDSSYRIIGHVKSDGTVQDSSYRIIGHAKGIPMRWAALYFFFL